MRIVAVAFAVLLVTVPLLAQDVKEQKPVPKDSVRVFVPGCSKGMIFTAGRRTEDSPGGTAVPEGTHLRMAGPKSLIAEVRAQEGSRIEITGIIKRGQIAQDGVRIAPGVRVTGASPSGGLRPMPENQIVIDVEGWRAVAGTVLVSSR